MEDLHFLIDLALAVGAAMLGGALAQRLRQPVLLGYLLAGVLIGPFTPGPIADTHSIQLLAELGVAFLMFTLGTEFSVHELRQLGRTALLLGTLQLALSMGLGPLLAPLLGLSLAQGVFLGALIALSSTVVALKLLQGRGEISSAHGQIALGILLVQDLAVVPLVVVLPALTAGSATLLTDLGTAALKGLAIVAVTYLGGVRLVPALLRRLAGGRSRELFLLSVIALALGTALLTQTAGLSLAFGAFLAGVVVAESDYRTQVLAEALPFRDVFAALFFVSVGMLINPAVLWEQIGWVALVSGVVLVGKFAIVLGLALAFGHAGRVAVLAAVSLAQVGEFSFVLARLGVDQGSLPQSIFDLILAVALVTIILTPVLLNLAPAISAGLARLPGLRGRFAAPELANPDLPHTPGQGVIGGWGRVGQELGTALAQQGQPFVAIEYNPEVVRAARAVGVPLIYGDAGNPAVLEQVGLGAATLLAVLIPDEHAAERAVRHAHEHFPHVPILARVGSPEAVGAFYAAGASAVVQPEFEAGMAVIRYTLAQCGIAEPHRTAAVAARRQHMYQEPPRDSVPAPVDGHPDARSTSVAG